MSHLQVGDVLEGRYRIDHPIARGGMSTVYRCVDLRLARAVAVKVMDGRYVDDPVFRHRFRREAQAMAQVSHPNLVGVFDFGSDGDVIFLVMELITGGTLRELLAERGPMPPHAATAVVRALLTGLATAHSAGMIHRDLKPDNVLIGADHSVKLADFGLVRAASAATGGTDRIVGTAAYLSPEQVRGDELTPASDVYSAGVVLFELLTGTTPFSGPTDLEHAYARLEADVPAPSSRIAGVPALFDELVAGATAREPGQRFRDAAEFLEALDDVARELELPAFTVPVPRNAAAHRAAAVPTDTTGLSGILAPTSVLGLRRDNDGGERPPEPSEPPAPAAATRFDDGEGLFGPADPAEPAPQTTAYPAAPPAPAAPAAPPAPAERPVSNRSGWRLAVWLTVVAVVLGAVAVGGWWLGSGRYGEIPQVIGLDSSSAVAQVEQAGFTAVTREVFDDEVPVSFSAGTDPASGEREVRGNQVAVLVSRGRPTVPEIPAGADAARYQKLLDERTLRWEYGDEVHSDEVAEGGLADVEPAAGTTVPVGRTVTLHVSKGPAPVEIPHVAGMNAEQATEVLTAAGLKVAGTTEEFDADTPAGEVVTTDPRGGTAARRGDSVQLHVSNAIEVPDVTGLPLEKARDRLGEAGLTVADTQTATGRVGDSATEVVKTSPAAGSAVDPASPEVTVTLPGKVKVPRVVGKRAAEARAVLESAGLTPSPADGDGRVWRQRPGSSREVSPGATVELSTTGRD